MSAAALVELCVRTLKLTCNELARLPTPMAGVISRSQRRRRLLYQQVDQASSSFHSLLFNRAKGKELAALTSADWEESVSMTTEALQALFKLCIPVVTEHGLNSDALVRSSDPMTRIAAYQALGVTMSVSVLLSGSHLCTGGCSRRKLLKARRPGGLSMYNLTSCAFRSDSPYGTLARDATAAGTLWCAFAVDTEGPQQAKGAAALALRVFGMMCTLGQDNRSFEVGQDCLDIRQLPKDKSTSTIYTDDLSCAAIAGLRVLERLALNGFLKFPDVERTGEDAVEETSHLSKYRQEKRRIELSTPPAAPAEIIYLSPRTQSCLPPGAGKAFLSHSSPSFVTAQLSTVPLLPPPDEIAGYSKFSSTELHPHRKPGPRESAWESLWESPSYCWAMANGQKPDRRPVAYVTIAGDILRNDTTVLRAVALFYYLPSPTNAGDPVDVPLPNTMAFVGHPYLPFIRSGWLTRLFGRRYEILDGRKNCLALFASLCLYPAMEDLRRIMHLYMRLYLSDWNPSMQLVSLFALCMQFQSEAVKDGVIKRMTPLIERGLPSEVLALNNVFLQRCRWHNVKVFKELIRLYSASPLLKQCIGVVSRYGSHQNGCYRSARQIVNSCFNTLLNPNVLPSDVDVSSLQSESLIHLASTARRLLGIQGTSQDDSSLLTQLSRHLQDVSPSQKTEEATYIFILTLRHLLARIPTAGSKSQSISSQESNLTDPQFSPIYAAITPRIADMTALHSPSTPILDSRPLEPYTLAPMPTAPSATPSSSSHLDSRRKRNAPEHFRRDELIPNNVTRGHPHPHHQPKTRTSPSQGGLGMSMPPPPPQRPIKSGMSSSPYVNVGVQSSQGISAPVSRTITDYPPPSQQGRTGFSMTASIQPDQGQGQRPPPPPPGLYTTRPSNPPHLSSTPIHSGRSYHPPPTAQTNHNMGMGHQGRGYSPGPHAPISHTATGPRDHHSPSYQRGPPGNFATPRAKSKNVASRSPGGAPPGYSPRF